jgi:hypothetical protein
MRRSEVAGMWTKIEAVAAICKPHAETPGKELP